MLLQILFYTNVATLHKGFALTPLHLWNRHQYRQALLGYDSQISGNTASILKLTAFPVGLRVLMCARKIRGLGMQSIYSSSGLFWNYLGKTPREGNGRWDHQSLGLERARVSETDKQPISLKVLEGTQRESLLQSLLRRDDAGLPCFRRRRGRFDFTSAGQWWGNLGR